MAKGPVKNPESFRRPESLELMYHTTIGSKKDKHLDEEPRNL